MKTLLLLTLATAAAAGSLAFSPDGLFACKVCCEGGPLAVVDTERDELLGTAVTGDYLEARSASVFAGACHTGSEAASQGRQAVVAWSLESGVEAGRSLAGVRLVAAISSGANLADGEERRCAVWIDAPGGQEQVEAARAWLEREHGEVLGRFVAVENAGIEFSREGDAFELRVPGHVDLAGEAIVDRSCCTMREERYYEPLAADAGAVVGVPFRCSFQGAAGLPAWRYEDANSAFVTRLGETAGTTSCGAPSRASFQS